MWLSLPECCNSATLDAATGISYVTPSRNCNSATLDQAANSSGSGSSFTIFGIGSPRTIPRRPTSTGLQVDEVTPVGCARHPATCGALLSRPSLRRESPADGSSVLSAARISIVGAATLCRTRWFHQYGSMLDGHV
jgi:hypothetical protein